MTNRQWRFGTLDVRRARRGAIVWGLFLLALTSWPSPPEVPSAWAFPDMDKVVHGLLYGVEGFLLYFAIAWPASPSRRPFLRALAVAGALAVWGTLDEIHQAFIPGRAMEGMDAIVDTAGGFLGALVASRAATFLRPWRSDPRTDSRGPAPSPTASES